MMNVHLRVPSHTQISRRAVTLQVSVKHTLQDETVDIAIDSTGVKVYGEGEWKVRQHGKSKRRTWRKVHLAVDPLNSEILAAKLTASNQSDDKVFMELLNCIDQPIERIFADGAYDTSDCYRGSYERGSELIVPPQRNAVIQSKKKLEWLKARDEAIIEINDYAKKEPFEEARSRWKYKKDYHQRSIAETAMYRLKRLTGSSLWGLSEASQQVEIVIRVNILNLFTKLGMPDSYPI